MTNINQILENYTAAGELYEILEGDRLRCLACGHRCIIPAGTAGTCKVRFNKDGILRVPFDYVAGSQCDPIEKKPFFHVRPGARAFSFGMLGCNFHCSFCQNWVTSQILRDPDAFASPHRTTPENLVQIARSQNAEIVVSTYNEPLITTEWGVAVFKKAKEVGFMTGYVSNGYATPEALEYLRPWLDLYKVDLKSFDDQRYRSLGGRLQPILETIRSLHSMGIWLEIVTLLIPGFNDSEKELSGLCEFIASVSPDIPWHVTAFHKNYKMFDPENTTPGDLLKAVEIGRHAGLRYVYAGNLPVGGKLENTYCPDCKTLLVERYGYRILRYDLTSDGLCPSCKRSIPGRWGAYLLA